MSASFASDSVRALALQLDQIERATDLSSLDALLSADKVSPGSLRTQDAAAHAAHAPSALAKLQSVVSSLDLGRGLQKREDLLKALEDLQSACTRGDIAAAGATATATEDDDATKAQESLLWLALARITFAAHGAVIHSLIDDATAMGENIWYWSDVEEDPIGALEYLVQTLPLRLTNLGRVTGRMLAENASSLRVSSSPRGSSDLFSSSNIRKTWKNLRASPTVAIGALFPYTSAGSGSSASASAVGVSSSGGNGAGNEEKRKRGRVLPITLLHALSPLYLTRHEARQKHRKLNKARDTLAERLGRLAQSVSVGALDQSSALSVQGNAADGQAASLDILKQDLVQRAGQLSQALLPVDAGNDEPPCPPSMSIEASSPLQLSAHLHELLSRTLPAHSARTRLLLSPSRLGRPSYLTRRWPIFILLPMSALLIGRAVSRNWETILQKVGDARETVTGFLVGWVYEPTLRLLDTVRHGQAEGSVIISRESLNSDLQSLERMVTSFSAEKYNLSGPELARVTARVKEGDLTHVLKIYESELKSPLKSAVSGSLIRALLIQIQKAKVDLEVAMSGIDRLLKSQELLFGAVGIAPAMGVLYVCGSWFKNQLADATGRGKKAASAKVRVQTWEAMRRIDRLLSLPPSGEAYDGSDNQHSSSGAGAGATPLPALTQGLLLLDLSLLRAISTPLLSRASGSASTSKRLRREFLQDVRDLEGAGQGHGRHHSHGQSREMRGGAGGRREGGSGAGAGAQSQTGLGWEARKAAMERMWRSWSSLFSVDGFA